jgi:cytochrome c
VVFRKLLLIVLLYCGANLQVTASDCDVDAGQRQFNRCAICHAVEAGQHGAGPSLASLSGREAGSVPGFPFSHVMAESGITWDEQMLSEFIRSPDEFMPGTTMAFGGLRNDEQRTALLCYLRML